MNMNYFVVGTNDMAAATQFYDALFDKAGFEKMSPDQRMTYFLKDDFAFALALPFDGQSATNGNGTMVGFTVDSQEEVERLYKTAIEQGGSCEGEPYQRGPRFTAYVRDLDKNKLCFSVLLA